MPTTVWQSRLQGVMPHCDPRYNAPLYHRHDAPLQPLLQFPAQVNSCLWCTKHVPTRDATSIKMAAHGQKGKWPHMVKEQTATRGQRAGMHIVIGQKIAFQQRAERCTQSKGYSQRAEENIQTKAAACDQRTKHCTQSEGKGLHTVEGRR